MAKQTGSLKLTGTFDNLCFYRMDGGYFVRYKSSIDSKRFWKDKAFDGSRKSASRFAAGNRLASEVYRKIPEEQKVYSLFCFLKRKSILLFKEGKSLAETKEVLADHLIAFGLLPPVRPAVSKRETVTPLKKALKKKTGSGYGFTRPFSRQPRGPSPRAVRLIAVSPSPYSLPPSATHLFRLTFDKRIRWPPCQTMHQPAGGCTGKLVVTRPDTTQSTR